jgi:phosphoglycerate dehydrogenase-like enzyme
MQRVFYPTGTKLAEEIFGKIPDSVLIPYKISDIANLKKEKGSVLVANTRLPINQETLREFPGFPIFATVSSGTDHVDFSALEKFGKKFLNSPGSNASSVAEYVLMALQHFYFRERFSSPGFSPGSELREENDYSGFLDFLKSKSICLFGFGKVGRALGEIFQRFQIPFVFYDPFVPGSIEGQGTNWESFDIVSLHMSLTQSGPFPSYEKITESEIRKLRPGSIFLNTSRGEVLTSGALRALLARSDLQICLDVFPQEPPGQNWVPVFLENPNVIYTPHIAGYSQIGRVQGTFILAQKLAREWKKDFPYSLSQFLSSGLDWKTESFLPLESGFLRDSWKKGDFSFFEKRRNDYPLREDLSDLFWERLTFSEFGRSIS